MISFPNAKINLGLFITEKRPDGFHNIETVFLPIPNLCDILEVIPLPTQETPLLFSQSGLKVDGDENDNLCVKSYNLLSQYIKLPSVAIHLHKQIPMGAGLGGGSADGAFALSMLNQLPEKPLSEKELAKLALELGSDCPFFLKNSICFGGGRGELLEPIDIKISGYYLLLVNPNIHVNTGLAYRQSTPSPAPFNLKQISEVPINKWKTLVINDFEKVVFPSHPKIELIKNELYSIGAVYSSMSGSGSTVFGIFRNKPEVPSRFKDFFTHISEL
jgi:4-diphosphocytidyl-2-C-methyl-D-erythritol kinase